MSKEISHKCERNGHWPWENPPGMYNTPGRQADRGVVAIADRLEEIRLALIKLCTQLQLLNALEPK